MEVVLFSCSHAPRGNVQWHIDKEVSMKTSALLDEVVSLPVEERMYLVDCLLQTLNPSDTSHTVAWADLADRRLDELLSGKVVPIPGETVFARIRQRYEK
jgi:putative addiction module component (TIGR02574 family)